MDLIDKFASIDMSPPPALDSRDEIFWVRGARYMYLEVEKLLLDYGSNLTKAGTIEEVDDSIVDRLSNLAAKLSNIAGSHEYYVPKPVITDALSEVESIRDSIKIY